MGEKNCIHDLGGANLLKCGYTNKQKRRWKDSIKMYCNIFRVMMQISAPLLGAYDRPLCNYLSCDVLKFSACFIGIILTNGKIQSY
jgi:hypothetical protein